MSKLKSLIVVAALGLAAPITASAAVSQVFNWSGCGGQNFASCATVVADYDDVTKILTFTVSNDNPTSGWPGHFTAVGWLGLGNTGLSPITTPSGWSFAASNQQGLGGPAGPGGWFSWADPGGGFGPPSSATFAVQFTSDPSFANFTFGVRETRFDNNNQAYGNCGTSNRLHVNNTGGVYSESLGREGAANCYPDPGDPNTSVPEPATMVLLATGLVGLVGVQYRRRRNVTM